MRGLEFIEKLHPAAACSCHIRFPAGAAERGRLMNLIYGVVILAVAVGLIVTGRPRHGKSPAFLNSWVVGQVYVLICLVCTVLGASYLIRSLPAIF
jgi:hypothetical protein